MASGQTLAIFTPLGYEPTTTNWATIDFRNVHPVLDFDTTTQETAIWTGVMPQHYAGGNITVYVTWTSDATSGTVAWGVTFERILAGTLDIDADSWATEKLISAVSTSGTSGIATTSNVTCTAGATDTDSVAAGDTFRLRVRRDVANDNAGSDANLLSVELREA